MYIAKRLNKKLHALHLQILKKKELQHSSIEGLFSDALKCFGVNVVLVKQKGSKSLISVSGEFDTEAKRMPILVRIHVSNKIDHMRATTTNIQNLMFLVFQVVCHETIHRSQCDSRVDLDSDGYPGYIPIECGSAMTDEQMYLSDVDELMAYGSDIALELHYFYPDTYEEELRSMNGELLYSYQYYKKNFSGTDWSCIQRRLLKYVYQWTYSIKDKKEMYHVR